MSARLDSDRLLSQSASTDTSVPGRDPDFASSLLGQSRCGLTAILYILSPILRQLCHIAEKIVATPSSSIEHPSAGPAFEPEW